MVRVLAALLALFLGLAAIGLLVAMLEVGGLALCDDPEAFRASGSDDCIESSSGARALGLVLGWAAVACAALGSLLCARYARRRLGAGTAIACAGLTPLLALAALLLLPVSF